MNYIINELFELNTYLFLICFNSKSIELERILRNNLDTDDLNFNIVHRKIEELMVDVKCEMRKLNSHEYNRWNLLDVILLNLEKSLQLISPYQDKPNLEMIFEELAI